VFGLICQGSRSVGLVTKRPWLTTLLEEFEVVIASHSRSAQVVLYYEHRDASVFWDDDRAQYVRPREYHVITFLANTLEVGEFKNANQDLVGDWANLRHGDLRVAL